MRHNCPHAALLQYMSLPESSEVTTSFAILSLAATDAPQEDHRDYEKQSAPRQTHFPTFFPSSEAFSETERHKSRESSHSGSDTERTDTVKMPSGSSSSKHHSSSSSSKKHSSSSSSKHRSKSDDWSDVTEPEERRRIQNRIAQRKFRRFFPCPSLLPGLHPEPAKLPHLPALGSHIRRSKHT